MRFQNVPPNKVYQRYRRYLQKVLKRQFTTLKSQIRKRFPGRNGKWLVCNICKGKDHFARDYRNRSTNAFAWKQLEEGTPEAHVLYDLTSSSDFIEDDQANAQKSRRKANLVSNSHSDLEIFDTIGKPHNETQQNCCASLNSSNGDSAAYHIFSTMNELYRGYYGIDQQDFWYSQLTQNQVNSTQILPMVWLSRHIIHSGTGMTCFFFTKLHAEKNWKITENMPRLCRSYRNVFVCRLSPWKLADILLAKETTSILPVF